MPEYEKDIQKQLLGLGISRAKIVTFMPYRKGLTWREPRYAMLRNCAEEIYARNIPGAVAEVGVYQGEFAAHLNRIFHDRKLFLFDTFQGFSKKDESRKDAIITGKDSFTDTTVECVMKKMSYPGLVAIRPGWFPDTARDIEESFAFVSLDTDLYQPILSGLEFFYPRLVHGGYIFVHDYGSHNWTGVKKAVHDFCGKNRVSFVPVLDKCMSIIITK